MFYETESSFFPKLLVVIIILGFVSFLFEFIMRKVLHTSKRSWFSFHYVNSLHKKVDWSLRGLFFIVIITGTIVNAPRQPEEPILFLEPFIIVFAFIILEQLVTIFMEWKYAENRNDYIFTALQLGFIVILLLSMYVSDFFGLFAEVFE